jgi:predicted SprT family Zn-dependent metalloprotease
MRLRTKILLTILLAIAYFWTTQHVEREKIDGAIAAGHIPQAKLVEWYADANKDYFDDQLPHDTEIVWYNLRYKKAMADTGCNEQGCIIRIDPYVNVAPATAQETLYHEMCHVKTWGADLEHGPEWQNCMTMLFRKGALDGLI